MAVKGAEANIKLQPPPRLLCAAIDFGTTYSGFAFSHKNDPKQILCRHWKGAQFQSLKTPTCLLLNKNKEFDSFGYDAEEKYSELANDDKEDDWYFFKQFKMKLHSQEHPLKRNSLLTEEGGKQMPAMTVFAMSIRYLKEQLIDEKDTRGFSIIKDEEITWVLTVPAIWDEEAKQFMREAAEEADIPGDQLIIALEPEAASVYVKEINVKRDETEDKHLVLSPYDPGTKFMVVDLGGGTVDITVREVMKDRTLKELSTACGNALGGNTVNDKMYGFIRDIVGAEVMDEFEKTQKAAAYDLAKEIESKKRSQDNDSTGKIPITLPGTLIELYESKEGKELKKSRFLETNFKKTVGVKSGKLKVDHTIFPNFFKDAGESILSYIQAILSKDFAAGLKDVILVGGFADSLVIRHSVEKLLPELTFIIPNEACLAVVKGAVLYGHNPNVVSARVSRYTIGTEVHRYFLDTDDQKKKKMISGTPYCKEVFNKLVEIGQTVRIGEKVVTEVSPLFADMTHMSVKVYKSTQKDPKYIDDSGCTYMGKMVVEMPDTSKGLDRCVKVSLQFGETEIKLTGKDDSTNKPVTVKLDMLS